MGLGKVVLPVLILVMLTATVSAATVYDFSTANELNNFNKVLIVNDTVQPFNSSLENVIVVSGQVVLSATNGSAGVLIPAQTGYLYDVVGKNIWIGVVYNGTVVGSIQVDKIGYAKVSDGEVILSNGVSKIAVESQADSIVIYSRDGSLDKIAIISPEEMSEQQMQLSAGNHLYSYSGTNDRMIYVHLHSGMRYRVTFNQGRYDWDLFVFAPTNRYYGQANERQSWSWLNDHRTFDIWADGRPESRTYTAPTTGNYKFIVKHATSAAIGHAWHLYIDQLSGSQHIQPINNNPSNPVRYINNIPSRTPAANDNPSAPFNIHLNNDTTKLMLFGIGIIVVIVVVVALTGKR